MFTGIVRERGRVVAAERNGAGMRLRISAPETAAGTGIGDSVSVGGCCLTAVAVDDGRARVRRGAGDAVAHDARPARTPAREVNLEPALSAGDPLGGHYVQGHVDGVGRVRVARARRATGRALWLDAARGAPALLRREGLDRGRRRLADGRGARRRRVRGRARPAHARGDDARRRSSPATRSTSRSTCSRSTSSGWSRRAEYDPGSERRPSDHAVRARSRRRSRTSARAGSSSSSTRPTARTRATSTIAAQFATPEAINFMATHGRGLICLCLTEERCDELGLRPMTERNETPLRHRVHRLDRGARGRHDGHLRRRPLAHDPGRDRPEPEPRRPRPARPRLPAARATGRRPPARRPDRGRGRPRAARGAEPRRRRLRDHERRRDDGPRAGPDPVLRAARPEA